MNAQLRLGASMTPWTAGGQAALPVADWAAVNPAQLGLNGVARRGVYGSQLPEAAARIIYGTGFDAYADDAGAAMALGLRSVRARADERINTTAWTGAMAAAELSLAILAARSERRTVPLQPEVDLWDPAAVSVAAALAYGTLRRITAIGEPWDATSGRYETTVE